MAVNPCQTLRPRNWYFTPVGRNPRAPSAGFEPVHTAPETVARSARRHSAHRRALAIPVPRFLSHAGWYVRSDLSASWSRGGAGAYGASEIWQAAAAGGVHEAVEAARPTWGGDSWPTESTAEPIRHRPTPAVAGNIDCRLPATCTEAAEMLGIGRTTAYKLMWSGRIGAAHVRRWKTGHLATSISPAGCRADGANHGALPVLAPQTGACRRRHRRAHPLNPAHHCPRSRSRQPRTGKPSKAVPAPRAQRREHSSPTGVRSVLNVPLP